MAAPSAPALNPLKPICGAAGLVSGIAGKACNALKNGGKIIGAGKKLLGGHVGGAVKTLLGGGSGATAAAGKAAFVVGFAAVGAWVTGGAKVALRLTAGLIDHTTRPQLRTTWFSSTYWRIAAIAAVLTMPFMFAAAIQALLRSDLTLLLRSALCYLPISLLAVSLAAPLTMLLLAVSDGMSAAIAAAAGGAGTNFLTKLGLLSGGLDLLSRSPFVTFFVGLLLVGASVLLWVEMLMRDAAIYVVVLMLPLVFAGFVWPARRVWAIRTIELLVALILSKFVIVCVLSLGGAALGRPGGSGAAGMLMGLVLVSLAALAPWALVRLLPMAELATAASGQLRGEIPLLRSAPGLTPAVAGALSDWASTVPTLMSRQAEEAGASRRGADRGSETEKLRDDAAVAVAGHAGDLRPAFGSSGVAWGAYGDAGSDGGGAAAGSGTASAAPADGDVQARTAPPDAQRRPGMSPGYQQPDMSWPAVMLGPEARTEGFGGLSPGPEVHPGTGPEPGSGEVEDRDSLPRAQPPESGTL